MFAAGEFQLIRSKCLTELKMLLNQLSIPMPNINDGNEFQIYEELDNDISKAICRMLKSDSIIDGYSKLLKLGNVDYDFSETDDELLRKILNNKDSIIQNSFDKYEVKICKRDSISEFLNDLSYVNKILRAKNIETNIKFQNIFSKINEIIEKFKMSKESPMNECQIVELENLSDVIKNNIDGKTKFYIEAEKIQAEFDENELKKIFEVLEQVNVINRRM